MKEKLSIREFKEYYEGYQWGSIIFSSENQKWYRASDPCKIQAVFRIVLISEHPSLIFLKSDTTELCLDRVRYIEVNTDETPLGAVVLVHCGGLDCNHPEWTYTLIAS